MYDQAYNLVVYDLAGMIFGVKCKFSYVLTQLEPTNRSIGGTWWRTVWERD